MPKQPLIPLPTRVPSELRDRVTDAANRSGQSISEFIRMVLDEATRERPPKPSAAVPEEVMHRLTQAVLFTEASFEAFLAQREGLTDELRAEAKRRTAELLTGASSADVQ